MLAEGKKSPHYLTVWGQGEYFSRAKLVAGKDLPGQANQQDAASGAAHFVRVNVHTPCKNARTDSDQVSLVQDSWLGVEPPTLAPIATDNIVARSASTGLRISR
jgi:hypothetical protein